MNLFTKTGKLQKLIVFFNHFKSLELHASKGLLATEIHLKRYHGIFSHFAIFLSVHGQTDFVYPGMECKFFDFCLSRVKLWTVEKHCISLVLLLKMQNIR